ncbi:MAG TPA: response regulator [Cellvibrio sp.]|nr:response regulator [Cellvibrio sp.]
MSLNHPSPLIFIIATDAGARQAKATVLKEAGFSVQELAEGHNLMTEIHKSRPDLIIFDSTLVFSGKLCRQLKMTPETQNIMILQLSAPFNESLDQNGGFDLDADNYLVEPLAPVELITNIKVLLRLSKNERLLRDLTQWKQDFLASFSALTHDFRNILAPILNSIEALFKLNPAIPPNLDKARNTIKFHAKSLTKIADEFFRASVAARGDIPQGEKNLEPAADKTHLPPASVTKTTFLQTSHPINLSDNTAKMRAAVTANSPIHKRVLIVDDYADVADTLAQWLRLAGHSVQTAYTGAQAIESTVAFQPDVVLLDIGLPDSSGFDIAKKLRALPNLQKFLLVAVTGYGQASLRKSVLEAGFDEHFAKPMDFEKLGSIGLHV